MKHLIIFLAFLFPIMGLAQNDVKEIQNAIVTGNTQVLSAYFNDEVDLTLIDEEDIYSKAEAISMIKSFYSDLTGESFTIKHEGTSKLNHQYYIGDFITTNKVKYRVTFFVKSISGQMKISQFRIEDF